MLKILTIPFDPDLGLFSDEALQALVRDHEVLSHDAHFFDHAGRPYWTLLVDLRPLQGSASAAKVIGDTAARPQREAEREAFRKLLDELDEVERARYQRLIDWRAGEAVEQGVPRYVIITNRQTMEIARREPRTLEDLRSVHGIGKQKLWGEATGL